MSKDLIQLVETGRAPWLCLDPSGAVAEASKGAADETFLRLDGKVFFPFVEPMKSRSKAPRRGWSEFVSELVVFAAKARALAVLWDEGGERSVERISKEIRKIPGFGGKGFRMKERVVETTHALAGRGTGAMSRWAEGGALAQRRSCWTWRRLPKSDIQPCENNF